MSTVLVDKQVCNFTINFLLMDQVNKYSPTPFTILSTLMKTNFFCSFCCIKVSDPELDVFSITWSIFTTFKRFILTFPAFGLNAERYFLPLRIQSECMKIRTRKIRTRSIFWFLGTSIVHHALFLNFVCSVWSVRIRFFSSFPTEWFCINNWV